jgi:hypothetical protein
MPCVPCSRVRCLVVVVWTLALAGCPLTMQDDYVVESVDRGIANPPVDPPDAATNMPEGSTELPDAAASAPDAMIGTGPCTRTTCAASGFNCGMVGDGCGAMLDCGSCKPDQVCGAKRPNHCDRVMN